MQKVQRSDIVDYQTYNDSRDEFRKQVLDEKEARRIHVGPHLTFLFETTLTVRYQIQEMMRIEHIVREADVQHEIDTYNELVGDTGEVGCTLLIEIDDPAERDVKLREWLGLTKHLYMLLDNGERVRAEWDQRQVGSDRLSAVQYLKFKPGTHRPKAIGVDHPKLELEQPLTDEQTAILAADASQ